MLFVGVDWGKRHHDLCLLDQDGMVLAGGAASWPGGELRCPVASAEDPVRWRSG